jgi:O-acetyl-ADP-ribose deacetylase (regulator of RNase III)
VGRITLIEGDICEQEVEAIVNPANTALSLGTGVAGAIQARGGNEIQRECDQAGPIELGSAALTGGGDLSARYVVHAAGIEPGGSADEASVRSAVRAALVIAAENGIRTIAVPAVGTGVGGFAMQRCAEVALEEARLHLAGETSLEEIRFVLRGEPAFRVFEMVNDSARVAAQMDRMAKLRESR